MSCSSDAARDAAPPPDVLIVLVDTLRADHLGTYGYGRETDPALARFAEDALRFTNAYATSSWTKPSTASLLTGLAPGRHGAVTGADRLDEDVTLLAERLSEAGYRTTAWSANPNVLDVWGFAQGFELFRDLAADSVEATADEFLSAWRERLAKEEDGAPFFHYLHTMEPHYPYAPPADRPDEIERWPYRAGRVMKPIQISPATGRASLRDTINAYDSEIAYSDSVFGRLLDDLKRAGRYENALIFYLSDHGEEFGDHGRGGHQRTLYEEVVRVPLLVKLPGNRLAGRTVVERASLLDVVPTVLAAVGIEAPTELRGVDLERLATGTSPQAAERALFFDLDREGIRGQANFVQQAVIRGPWKLVRAISPEPFQALFHLTDDPGETRDRSDDEPELVAFLSASLDAEAVASATGFHLILENTARDEDHELHARLTSAGRFVAVDGSGIESGDTFAVSDDAHTLDVRVRLENVPNPAGTVPRTLIDVDGIRFLLDPEDAPLSVELFECSSGPDGPAAEATLRLGPSNTSSVPATISDPRTSLRASGADLGALRSSDPTQRPRSPRATLIFIETPSAPAIGTRLEDRLGALGYGSEQSD